MQKYLCKRSIQELGALLKPFFAKGCRTGNRYLAKPHSSRVRREIPTAGNFSWRFTGDVDRLPGATPASGFGGPTSHPNAANTAGGASLDFTSTSGSPPDVSAGDFRYIETDSGSPTRAANKPVAGDPVNVIEALDPASMEQVAVFRSSAEAARRVWTSHAQLEQALEMETPPTVMGFVFRRLERGTASAGSSNNSSSDRQRTATLQRSTLRNLQREQAPLQMPGAQHRPLVPNKQRLSICLVRPLAPRSMATVDKVAISSSTVVLQPYMHTIDAKCDVIAVDGSVSTQGEIIMTLAHPSDAHTTTDTAASSSEQLSQFTRRRKLATATLGLITFRQAFVLGSSVIAGSLLNQFTVPPLTSTISPSPKRRHLPFMACAH